jgi:hypothetical protein
VTVEYRTGNIRQQEWFIAFPACTRGDLHGIGHVVVDKWPSLNGLTGNLGSFDANRVRQRTFFSLYCFTHTAKGWADAGTHLATALLAIDTPLDVVIGLQLPNKSSRAGSFNLQAVIKALEGTGRRLNVYGVDAAEVG